MNTKIWYKSKTIQIAILQAVIGVVAVFGTHYPELGYIALVKSVLDVFLRVTTQLPVALPPSSEDEG